MEYRRLVAARAARVPLQHLTGLAWFRRLELRVGPGVFVPRPETELLVEWGLAGLSSADGPAGPRVVVDLCSGSGAVALAVADERPDVVVYAVEADPGAARWLERNIATYRCGHDVRAVLADATRAETLAELDGTVDLVLCNPPYVPDGTAVEREVAEHDPAVAVFGGPDGLDVIRGIIVRAAGLLAPGGRLGIEHDETRGAAVAALLRADDRYHTVDTSPDLADRPRFSTAVRRGVPEGSLADWHT